jgi:hypothetical protein
MQSTLFITVSRNSGKPTRYFKGEKMMLVYRFPTFTLGIFAVLHGEILFKKTRRGSSLDILKGKQLRDGRREGSTITSLPTPLNLQKW